MIRAQTRIWEVTPDLLTVFDLDGHFLHCNPAWQTALGRSPEMLAGSSYTSLLHPDDVARSQAEFLQAVTTGEPVHRFENRYRHRNGGYRWLSWVAVPVDEAVYCSARDIIKSKRLDTELAERTRVWMGSKDLYVTTGVDGIYRELNPAWRTELGHDLESLIGKGFDTLVHPEQLEAVREEFARVVAGERATDYEIRVRAVDGGYRWYSFNAFLEDGVILTMGRNVDQRRQDEADLEAAAEALRQS